MAKVVIDGKEMEFQDGTLLFDACKEARGESLPHFCYHPDLSIAGVCRLCQVEVEGMPKLTIACNTTVRDGMVVNTRSKRVIDAQRKILEMHLINHPVDCPICDQAGECGLQNQYMKYGLYESNVCNEDKVTNPKAVVIGPEVILDKDRCILCSRCVRFCREVTKTGEMGIFNRGDRAEIGTAPGVDLDNAYSLNTVDNCPVGALTSRDFRFKKRVWMLKSADSICPGCATGCNVRLDFEAETLYRIKPRQNDSVNGRWMCDHGRLEYKTVAAADRLQSPMLKSQNGDYDEINWLEFNTELEKLDRPGLVISSPFNSLEEQVLISKISVDCCGGNSSSGFIGAFTGESDDLLISADKTPNRIGAKWAGLNEHSPEQLVELINSADGSILIHNADIAQDKTVCSALSGKQIIYLGTHTNLTSDIATLVAPVCSWAEKDGSFVNKSARVQLFGRAVARPQDSLEDWRLLSELMKIWGIEKVPQSLPDLRRLVSESVSMLRDFDMNSIPSDGAIPESVILEEGGKE